MAKMLRALVVMLSLLALVGCVCSTKYKKDIAAEKEAAQAVIGDLEEADAALLSGVRFE